VTTRQDLWELASVIAFERLGLVPLRKVDGECIPPKDDLAAMDPEAARKARRKYRKIWRRDLARELHDFEKAPKRLKKNWRWTGASVRGRWRCDEDPLTSMMYLVAACEVGERPSKHARGYRWARVKNSVEYNKELLKVALGLGLVDPRRNM
jgi:hypothetical protein